MARKPQIKGQDTQSAALPTNDNDRFVHAALYKVDTSGNILTTNPLAPFLLNPDSMEDSKSGNWIENNIPGQSDPIMQWVSGGTRNLNFTALVTKDTVHYPEAQTDLGTGLINTAITAVGSIASAFAGVNIPPVGGILDSLLGNGAGNVGEVLSIAPHLDYYRSLMYPTIDGEGKLASSPPLLVLAMGKTLSSLSYRNVTGSISANDTDLWIAKNISIRITKWHPNLTPIEAEVSFQLAQYSTKSRGSYTFEPNEVPIVSTGGGFGGFI